MISEPKIKEVYSKEDLVSKVEEGDMIHIKINSDDKGFMVFYTKKGEYYTFIKRRDKDTNIINITIGLDDKEIDNKAILFDGYILVKSTNWSLDIDDVKIPSTKNSIIYRKKDEMLRLVGM